MLYKSAIDTELLRILDQLMKVEAFTDLRLVGGTSLALQIGHRQSVDIDLFGSINFEAEEENIDIHENLEYLKKSKNINILSINHVKVDIVNYRYPWIAELVKEENYRLASLEDIGAMKLNAITGRGTKKDFVDIFYLLKIFPISDLFNFYLKKFDDGNLFLVKKSLAYFEDAEAQPMPVMTENIEWREIKNYIKHITRQFIL